VLIHLHSWWNDSTKIELLLIGKLPRKYGLNRRQQAECENVEAMDRTLSDNTSINQTARLGKRPGEAESENGYK
jgi:hypothetical protein